MIFNHLKERRKETNSTTQYAPQNSPSNSVKRENVYQSIEETSSSNSPLLDGRGNSTSIPPNGIGETPADPITPSEQEVLNTAIDLEQMGLRKYTTEDIQENHKLLYPGRTGQSTDSVGVRLRSLYHKHYFQKEKQGKYTVYWRIR